MRSVTQATYTYKVLPFDSTNFSAERLNSLGAEGWLLVATLPQLVFVRSQLSLENPNELPLLLTIKQASERLGISRSKLYEYINSGRLSCVRLGKSVRIPQQELAIFVRENVVGGA